MKPRNIEIPWPLALALIIAMFAWHGEPATSGEDDKPKKIRCSSLEIVDRDGQTCMRLFVDGIYPKIKMGHTDTKVGCTLSIAGLNFTNDNNIVTTTLRPGSLTMHEPDMRLGSKRNYVYIQSRDNGRPAISIFREDRKLTIDAVVVDKGVAMQVSDGSSKLASISFAGLRPRLGLYSEKPK